MAGTLVVSNLNDGTNTGNTTDMIKGSARAWVNFNGTGTVAIRASYNVSSITDNGVGNYTVNFTTAMIDANYSMSGFISDPEGTGAESVFVRYPTDIYTSSSVQIRNAYNSAGYDGNIIGLQIFR